MKKTSDSLDLWGFLYKKINSMQYTIKNDDKKIVLKGSTNEAWICVLNKKEEEVISAAIRLGIDDLNDLIDALNSIKNKVNKSASSKPRKIAY